MPAGVQSSKGSVGTGSPGLVLRLESKARMGISNWSTCSRRSVVLFSPLSTTTTARGVQIAWTSLLSLLARTSDQPLPTFSDDAAIREDPRFRAPPSFFCASSLVVFLFRLQSFCGLPNVKYQMLRGTPRIQSTVSRPNCRTIIDESTKETAKLHEGFSP